MPQKDRSGQRKSTAQQGYATTTHNRHTSTKPTSHRIVHVNTQQTLLNVYRRTFQDLLTSHAQQSQLEAKLQHVKTHLYNRNFAEAFGSVDLLRAYAARWSPTRALAYHTVFQDLGAYLSPTLETGILKVLCLGGGGGAELVGLCGLFNQWFRRYEDEEHMESARARMNVTIVDLGHWSPVLRELLDCCRNELEAIYSIEGDVAFTSIQENLLDSDILDDGYMARCVTDTDLITIFYTLNELFNVSLPKTQTLLLNLTRRAKKGAVLVVVDSAGSYSTVGLGEKKSSIASKDGAGDQDINQQTRQYPMAWLLDHVLLRLAAELSPNKKSPWSKLEMCESRWFRLSDQLHYPIKLEDMRYQLHVYQHG